MCNDNQRLLAYLQSYFPSKIQGLHLCWDQCAWSCVYRVDLSDGTHLFLKGTLRSMNEALITQRLRALNPSSIPRVIDEDLIPDDSWRWFLLDDAGHCTTEALSPDIAREAAYHLGVLQRGAMDEHSLSSFVVPCEGDHLQHRAIEVCAWAIEHAQTTTRNDIAPIILNVCKFSHILGRLSYILGDFSHTYWARSLQKQIRQL